MKVVIIGSGNVATVLGKVILQAGHSIEQVISKSEKNAIALADILNASASCNLLDISLVADLYIIAVPDQSIGETASQLVLKDKLVVHTAASVPKDVLKITGGNYGVLYPIQSLKKELTYTPEIPIAIDGSTPEVINILTDFAAGWASNVTVADDDARLKLHVAAVATSNFINHLCSLVEIYCRDEKIDFKLLQPLIIETANRLKSFSPLEVQTGPAVRGDMETIDKHLSLLAAHPQLKQVYQMLTDSIFYSNLPKS